MKKKILIFGKKGQLAQSLNKNLKKKYYIFTFLSSKDCDFENYNNIIPILKNYSPDLIINCSAYTNVDKAEIEKKKSKLINEIAVAKIAKYCGEKKIFLIHFSTDYIYNRPKKYGPINENSKKIPINYYGKTKLDGEKKIIESKCDYIILRISWTYSIFGNNFVKFIIKNLKEKNNIQVVNDQFGCPTNLDILGTFIYILINKVFHKKIKKSQIINYSHNGLTSWYKLAKKIRQHLFPISYNNLINPISSKNLKRIAKRPKYSKLSNLKLRKFYKKKIHSWDFYLVKFLNKYKKDLI